MDAERITKNQNSVIGSKDDGATERGDLEEVGKHPYFPVDRLGWT